MKDAKQRLQEALTLLGVNQEAPVFAAPPIIGAVAVHASVIGDQEMVEAANQLENELETIARPNVGAKISPSM